MIWIYRILFLPALLVLLPYYAWRMWRRGGYRHDFHHRFGLIDRPPPKRPGVKRLWIQAVSVGEANALGPLLERLHERPNTEVVLTTTTSTGYRILREKFAGRVLKVGIFPLDFWPFSRNAWRRLEPDAAVLMEAELWPEHLRQAQARGVPVVLINARMSDRSFARYKKLRGIAQWLLGQLRRILCASRPDEERFRALGADAARLRLTGSIKFDAAPKKLSEGEIAALRAELGFAPAAKAPVILLGSSTWVGEEVVLLGVLQAAIAAGVDARLLLVPRHAERRNEIVALLERQPLPWHARAQSPRAPQPVKIYLGDTTGELARLTQAADVAFIGKSLPPHQGGQTPIEAAAAGLPLVYGPRMSNFKDACRGLEEAGAALRVDGATAAHVALVGLLRDPARRAKMGAAARAWHAANLGATERTLTALNEVL
ncbi:MAG TPA: glycosyltransferase N-terminal domain-containing protein [Opitutales bacterium]|nr:glycosyltransferase N-terminal domain-containing protein [Opitutales bacterium]